MYSFSTKVAKQKVEGPELASTCTGTFIFERNRYVSLKSEVFQNLPVAVHFVFCLNAFVNH